MADDPLKAAGGVNTDTSRNSTGVDASKAADNSASIFSSPANMPRGDTTRTADNSASIFKFGQLTISTKGVNAPSSPTPASSPADLGTMLGGGSKERTVYNTTGDEILDSAASEFLAAEDAYFGSSNETANNASQGLVGRFMSAIGLGSKDNNSTSVNNDDNDNEMSNMGTDTGGADEPDTG